MKRAKWAGLVRNACVALGNSLSQLDAVERRRASELLTRLAGSRISTIAESAQWALSRIE